MLTAIEHKELFKTLEFDEGFKATIYRCSEGFPSIGIGYKLSDGDMDLAKKKLAQLGITEPISRAVALSLMQQKIAEIDLHFDKLKWFQALSGERKVAICNMAYQMGIAGVMKFKKMIAALEAGKWDEARKEALNSKWAKQTPARAKRVSSILKFNSYASYQTA